jgi:hypothetical protein
MKKPILYSYFDKKAQEMLAAHNLSSEQQASRNLGDNREYFVNSFLKKVLPPKLTTTSGEIWDKEGNKTGQIDTIIIRDDAPSLTFGSESTYLAEGVFATIEIKSNLTTTKLEEAAKTLKRVEKLQVTPPEMFVGANLGRPLRVVFAYQGAKWETLVNSIQQKKWEGLFDLICILTSGALIPPGGLLAPQDPKTGKPQHIFTAIPSKAAALGMFYFYLTQYGSAFSAGGIQLHNYFEPFDQWSE